MSVSLQQINNHFVEAIPIPYEDKRPIKGGDLVVDVFENIFLCARKKVGKTSTLFKIMKECAGRKTIIIVFCSTAYKDKNWVEIRKYFEKKEMDIRIFTSLFDEGENQLANLRREAKDEAEHKR